MDQFGALIRRSSERLARTLTELAPDLIHAHFGYDAVLAAPTASRLGLPMVVTLHGTDILREWSAWASGDMGFFFRFYPRAIQRMFADPMVHFLAVSDSLRAQAIRRGVPHSRLSVAYTGIDTASFDNVATTVNSSCPMILFVGRLVPFKGCEFLIRAMPLVHRRFPNCRLVIVGDGPLRPELTKLSSDLGVAAEFTGLVQPASVRDFMAQATLFCLPSVTETDGSSEAFGMVVLEAQAAGVPVLTSAPAGQEAILPGKTGELFAERDVSALSTHIITLLKSPDRCARFSTAARAHARSTFDIGACTARIEAIYDRIVAK